MNIGIDFGTKSVIISKYPRTVLFEYDSVVNLNNKTYSNIKLLIQKDMSDEIQQVLVYMFQKIKLQLSNLQHIETVITIPNNTNAITESIIFTLAN